MSRAGAGLDIQYGIGLRARDDDLPDGTRLYEWMHGGRPILLGEANPMGWADRVDVFAAKGEAKLIRPDGYVAWTAGQGDEALRAALTKWCGPECRARQQPGQSVDNDRW